MSSLYLQNIQTGLIYFLVLGLALLVPVVALHYFRFGRVEPRRSFVLYATLLYGLVMLALVFMPFPPVDSVCTGRATTQFVPFQFVADIGTELAKHNRSGVTAWLTSKSMLSFAFNVALFVPMGVLLRKAWGLKRRWVVLAGFGLSLAIEITQLTGNFGIYPCAYRLFDVDDLMANTAGAALGGLIAPAALIVPKVLPLADSRALLDAASLPRQVVAYCLDMFLIGMGTLVLRTFTGFEPFLLLVLVYGLVRLLMPVLDHGYTPAGRLLKFRVRKVDGSPATVGRLVLREVFGPVGVLTVLGGLAVTAGMVAVELLRGIGTEEAIALLDRDLFIIIGLTGVAVFTLVMIAPVFRRDQRAWHDLIAGLRCVLDVPRPVVVVPDPALAAQADLAGSAHDSVDAPDGPRSPAL
ncbi:glycopeptide antibiotics resistance protein/uncharacterized RDD family membrane protein YckC [Crossiella equi]|uniref:Glycopeptide antibiotics resistance protein/uncharacterized RDD family membrane protein YckC n=1 Tax=Crossiella equi TaxID=130796 RepID=A0ABS5AG99_9PSEU|nr:VanZ family protein [Crossiella equi]MBP2475613.1 glycopeptide antibiotics resistance protein/uncharacterized RDD family membrane protein YckC [Crossiella equi]